MSETVTEGQAPTTVIGDALRGFEQAKQLGRFRSSGVPVLRRRFPMLVGTVAPGLVMDWRYKATLRTDPDDPEEPCAVRYHLPLPPEIDAVLRRMALKGDVGEDMEELARRMAAFSQGLAQEFQKIVAAWRPAYEAAKAEAGPDAARLAQRVAANLGHVTVTSQEHKRAKAVRRRFRVATEEAVLWQREMARVRRLNAKVGYGDYVDRLAGDRAKRRIVFHAGPTNSGKTHAAMQALAQAETGLYLAPLRLLALEGYERMKAAGAKAGMVTGEEVIDAEGATHTAHTIETMPREGRVGVAVIDEVQMLSDPERGWAWTRALFGVDCDTLVLCGAEEALPLVERAAAITGEGLEVVRHERKTPLVVEDEPFRLHHARPGDALIAFSRREVLMFRELLIKRGHSVAAVYGGLSPEVRRAEAERFASGEADILVATDAIGMGLNLGPLQRVVFTDLWKFDGTRKRPLLPEQIKQIAGRAGRFGHHEVGHVASMERRGHAVIRSALGHRPDRTPRSAPFLARPDADLIRAAAEELGTTSLAAVLECFRSNTVYQGSPFRPSSMDELVEIAALVDPLDLSVEDKFAFATCPLDRRDHGTDQRLLRYAKAHARGEVAEVPETFGGSFLEAHEATVRAMSSYLWLARRFPETFARVEEATARRSAANEAIETHLRETAVRRAQHVDEADAGLVPAR